MHSKSCGVNVENVDFKLDKNGKEQTKQKGRLAEQCKVQHSNTKFYAMLFTVANSDLKKAGIHALQCLV